MTSTYIQEHNRLFGDLTAALGRDLAHLSGQAQPRMALGALEILVAAHVFEPVEELARAGGILPPRGHELHVLGIALFDVARENAKDRQYVACHSQQVQQAEAQYRAHHRQHHAQHQQRQ